MLTASYNGVDTQYEITEEDKAKLAEVVSLISWDSEHTIPVAQVFVNEYMLARCLGAEHSLANHIDQRIAFPRIDPNTEAVDAAEHAAAQSMPTLYAAATTCSGIVLEGREQVGELINGMVLMCSPDHSGFGGYEASP